DGNGSFGQYGVTQWRNQCIEIFLMAVGQPLRPATGGQVRVVCQYLPYRDARLVLTAKAPERCHKNRLRGQPAWLVDQNARGEVSCRHKITEVKSCPRLVHHTLVAAKRAKPLRLLFILGGLPKIASIAVKHSCHVVGARAVWAEGNRLLSGSYGIVVAALKQTRITERRVSLLAVRGNLQNASRTFQ